jgi:tRNA(Ile2)-agmatinylcytidine synthase
MLIGIDDTDSKRGMCTTYLGTLLKKALEQELNEIIQIRLVRLNPTIRFKTRGNASICLSIRHSYDVQDIVRKHIERMAHLDDNNTHPGAVFFNENAIPADIQCFARDAVHAELRLEKATELIEGHGLDFLSFKCGRGLIGALAAIGATVENCFSYELIAYRFEQNFAKKRYINEQSVWRADMATYPYTWDTLDRKGEAVICAPHSSDPILYGIRGDDPHQILAAQSKIISEPFQYLTLYRTNQGTDAHVRPAQIRELQEGRSYKVTAVVTSAPWTITGGHTFIIVGDNDARLLCVAFEPTKQFRTAVRGLRVGDKVVVQGSYIKNCLHLEKLRVLELCDQYRNGNPICCDKSMKSLGRDKGFKCSRCKAVKDVRAKRQVSIERELAPGAYEVTPSARRHLAEPLIKGHNRGYAVFPSR